MPRAELNGARVSVWPRAHVMGQLSCLGATVFLLLSNPSPAAAQPAWTGAVTTIADEQATDLSVVSDGAGNATAVWMPLQSGTIRVAQFRATTAVWSAPAVLQSGAGAPQIAMNRAGDAVVIWTGADADGSRIRTARYSATTGSWSIPVVLAASSGLNFSAPHVALDPSGNATAAWQASGASDGFTSQVQAAYYGAAAGAWSAPVDVTPLAYNGSLAAQPRVVMDASGHATIVFWSGPPGTRALYASRLPAGGGAWSSPQSLHLADRSSQPQVALDGGGNVMAVWSAMGATGTAILAARYAAASGQWSDPQTLATVATSGFAPRAVVDGAGNATVAWDGPTPQGRAVFTCSYSPSSGSWSAPLQMSAPGFADFSPGLAVDGVGTVTAVWTERNGNVGLSTTYASRRVSGQAWSTPVALRDTPGLAVNGFASASDGEVTVLWSDLKSTRWSQTGAEAVAAPTGLRVDTSYILPGQAAIGAPIRVSWSPSRVGLPVTGYRLEAGTGPGLRDLADVDVGAATQLTATVPAVRRIVVRIRAVSGATVGPPSSEFASLVYGVCPRIETRPSGLAATVVGNIVTLSWQTAPGAGSYVLEAGSAPGVADLVSANIGGASQYTTVAPPGTYHVRVRGANNCDVGDPSNEVVVRVAGATAPGAPVLHPPTVSGHTVSLSWTPGSGSAPANYTLTASTTPGGAPIATFAPTGTSAAFADVPSGTYYLRLTASNAAGTGPPSAQVSVTVP